MRATQNTQTTQYNNGSARSARRTLTVCVVDPEAADYLSWQSLARDNSLQFEVVASAEEALRRKRSGNVDLWVINSELPGLSGCELCSMLKSQSPHTAVYLVANQYSAESERAAWRARATCFGCKPAHETLLAQWLDHRAHCDMSESNS